ncbi:hypothetical protein Tco_0994782 [Tanacetum coccineum]
MVEPLSPDHVFDFPADNPTLDAEDPDMEVEEDPEEMPGEDPEEVIPPIVASPHGSPPISPPRLLESSSDYEFTTPGTAKGTLWVTRLREDTRTLYGSVRTLERGMRTRQTEIVVTRTRVDRIRRRIDAFDVDLGLIKQDATRVSDDVLALQEDSARDREENMRLERRLDELEVSGFMFEVMRRGVVEARPSESIDVLAVYGDAHHSEPQGPPDGP